MKLSNINEEILLEDTLFIENIVNEDLKSIAKKALKLGNNILGDIKNRGINISPKLFKFFNSPYGKITLALAINAAAVGVAPGAVDDILSNIGDNNDYDNAVDAIQSLSDNEQMPDQMIDNLNDIEPILSDETIIDQKEELINILRDDSRLGDTSSSAIESKLDNAINHVMNADKSDVKKAASEAFRYVQSSYNLEDRDAAQKLKELLLDIVKTKLSKD